MASDPRGGNLFTFRFVREPPGKLGLDLTLNKLADQIGNFKLWGQGVAAAFYEVERTVFSTEGERLGRRWAELTPEYAARKQKRWGDRPIMVASGRLRSSLTEPPRGAVFGRIRNFVSGSSQDAVMEVTNSSLVVGTTVEYGGFHQFQRPSGVSGTSKRRPLLAGPEAYVLVMTDRGVKTLEDVIVDTLRL